MGPVFRWRFTGRTPSRVLIAPPDLRLADPQIALEIYHGRFPLAGQMVETAGASPFSMTRVNANWRRSLHGFRWLRHMRAADTTLAAGNARALVADWLAVSGRRIAAPAWAPDVTARRLIAWLQHSPVVLAGADIGFYRAFLKSLAIQMRYLRAIAGEMPDGEERLRARIALVYAALSLPVSPARLKSASRALADELERQILPDGMHVSRNPAAILELLADLLPLRQTYFNQAEPPPDALIGAIERMLPALRFFRHSDGVLARFNGMGATSHHRVAAVLHHDDTGGRPVLHASHGGYDRLSIGETAIIADTGAPPPANVSHQAQAGCLSFEMSSGRNHFIVNCGVDGYGAEEFRILSRATAAHSTATVNETSSARFAFPGRLERMLGQPLIAAIRKVECRRLDGNGIQAFVASHDGYARGFGVIHEREIALGDGGALIEGADRFFSARPPQPIAEGLSVDIRFHLHPEIGVYRDGEGRIVLRGSETDIWSFESGDEEPAVEESMFFAALGGPRRSRQLVLRLDPARTAEITWRMRRIETA